MTKLALTQIQPWSPHSTAAPVMRQEDQVLTTQANGTRTCIGGWQLTFSGASTAQSYRITTEVKADQIDNLRDTLRCTAYWGDFPPDEINTGHPDVVAWDYLLPEVVDPQTLQFQRCLTPPTDGTSLTLRYTFRWSPTGSANWCLPQIEAVSDESEVAEIPPNVKIAVVTGKRSDRQGPYQTIQDNAAYYTPLCEAACRENPSLIVLPEIALQWGLKGSPIDLAVPAPGPETEVFAEIAQRYQTRILLGLLERDGDAVHNSAVLIDPAGKIEGRYRKVHLAVGGEIESGILPGNTFPVFQTELGRIGCNICMDSSATESSRMIGLNGADFLLLPIMGDHRAWYPGVRVFDSDRFRGIMKTRAMDNQLCVVVAVNRVEGSCIIDRLGTVLAWNNGDQAFISATVQTVDGHLPASKGCYRSINWMQRRPHVYNQFVEAGNRGGLLPKPY